MLSDLEKQLVPKSDGVSVSTSRSELCVNAFGLVLLTVLVCLISARMILDIAIETTILERLKDKSITIG